MPQQQYHLHRSAALLLLAASVAGCASSGEYACPDPIGQIIRDECEVYKTKYESLKVELGASVGPLGAKVSLGQQSLRDPSQLLQVLAHRTHALCRDFNACRVPPMEYRAKREQTDCIFTAVSALSAQLKQELDKQSKARVVGELVRALSGETCGGARASSRSSGGGARSRTPSRPSGGTFYASSSPWFGTKNLPPQPGAPGGGFPTLVQLKFSLSAVFRQKRPHGVVGYSPGASVLLRGKASPDDMVTVQWGGGQSSECPVRRGRNNLLRASCKASKSVTMTGSAVTATVVFRRGADGKSKTLGRRQARVLIARVERTKNNSHRYGVDHDDEARQGLLVFRPVGRYVPPALERPHLKVVLRLRKYSRISVTARCWVDGKLLPGALKASRYSGQTGSFQDRDRYRQVAPGRSRSTKDHHLYWRHYDFPLPFFVRRQAGGSPPEGTRPWPATGRWRCVVSVEGEPARELKFLVKGDGRLEPHPRQTERPRAGWLLETQVLRSPAEEAF
jgi:hypothetical protein